MVYEWKAGCVLQLDPQAVGTVLEDIERRDGRVTPEAVVDEARKPSSVLHPAFEWDDRVAAEQYRLQQARYILRHIVVREVAPEAPMPVRAFVVADTQDNDDEERGRGYVHIRTAMSDPALRDAVLAKALAELNQWRQRYANLSELAKVFAALDQALANF